MKTLVNTTLCYIEKDGCYLMLHRTKKENDYNHDKWIGIGGKFEDGESPEDCVIREVFEETGLTLEPCDLEYRGIVTFVDFSGGVTGAEPPLEGVADNPIKQNLAELQGKTDSATWSGSEGKAFPFYTEFMHIFYAKRFSGSLRSDCDEGILEWIPVSKMNEIPHWKGDEIFLDFIEDKRSFFSLKLEYRDGVLLRSFLDGVLYDHFKS